MIGLELVKVLEAAYPDKASVLKGKTEIEREVYLAQLEMIEHIKQIIKKG